MGQQGPDKAELPRLALVSHRHRFVYVPVPKCGTTTMIQAMATLHGLGKAGRVRRMIEPSFWTPGQPPGDGLSYHKIAPPDRQAFLDAHAGYRFVSIVRDPVARAASNYRNKLNRYASRFARPAYLAGKLAAYAVPFSMKRQLAAQNRVMRRLISPCAFAAGLEAHGVMWDRHFWPQSVVLGLGRVSYAALLSLERLEPDLKAFLAGCGVGEADLARLFPLPRNNLSQEDGTLFDAASVRIIEALYESDRAAFGQACAPAAG